MPCEDEIVIRDMTLEDVPFVCEIEEATFSMPWKEKDFLEMIEGDNMTYVVAQCMGKIIGGSGFTDILGEGQITNVAVLPEYRNKGIGRRILEALLKRGEEIGAKSFTLEVRVSNASAISLYHRLGFSDAGVRPGFYENPTEDALIMWRY